MNEPPATTEARPASSPDRSSALRVSRRRFLLGAGAALGAWAGGRAIWDANERFQRASVFVAEATRYDDSLAGIVRRGLEELGIGRDWARGRSILLKPNLVEPNPETPHVNTHPAVVRAAAEVFRQWDAREVFIAEGQANYRDTYFVLDQSGLGPVLDEARLPFIDLNYDDVDTVPNRAGFTALPQLHLPRSLRRADRVVSLAKLKTHHWAGVTLSMKNLFGVLPGICYGWPKNVLHHAGIGQTILDIHAAVRPDLTIIDGILGAEGDGPINGTPKRANLLVMGRNLPATDATAARLMGFDPQHIDYLRVASGRFGPIREPHIEQRGEELARLAQRFELPDHPFFRVFRPTA